MVCLNWRRRKSMLQIDNQSLNVKTAAGTIYDAVLYPGHALAQAHPDRLATMAKLFGMAPPDPSRCRVLELGCGDGLNLISVALGLTGAECVGIDLAAAGIRRGQAIIEEIGLRNITLRVLDIVDAGDDLGRFDFIIAHGIYSWVPAPVRDKLLTICKKNLSDNGVAYVSYNTYPGAHFRNLAAEMMRFHVSEITDARKKVEQARALVKFIVEASAEPDLYRMVLGKELERLTEFADSSVFHDDLADHDAPVYFYQFVEHAARHGLKYLAEAHFFEMQAGIFPAEVVQVLNRISDGLVAKEQYLDFLKCRRFRQTLLCHEACPLDYEPRAEKIASMHVASPLRPETPAVSLDSAEKMAFTGPKDSSIGTDNPLIKAALLELGEAWPQALHFSELLRSARRSCGREATASFAADADLLGELLLRAYAGGIVELHVEPPRFTSHPGVRPVASPLARAQSREEGDIINLRHHNIRIEDALDRRLLMLLDGSRDRAALVDEFVKLAESGVATVESKGGARPKGAELREFLAAEVERRLAELASNALLVG